MRVCFVTRSVPFHDAGGFENFVFQVGAGLVERGHEVWVVTKRSKLPAGWPRWKMHRGMRVGFVGPSNYPFEYSPWFFVESGRLVRSLERHGLDVVVSNNLGAFGYLLLSGFAPKTPVVAVAHATAASEALGVRPLVQLLRRAPKTFPVVPLEWVVFGCASKIVAVSPNTRRLVAAYRGDWLGKTVTVFNGVDGSVFRPFDPRDQAASSLRSELGLRQELPTFAYVGRLTKLKGAEEFVDVLGALDRVLRARGITTGFQAVVVGSGPLESALREKCSRLGLEDRVVFAGNRDRLTELPRLYSLASALVFPSLHPEGMPLTVLEAMGAGTPVVAYSTPGLRSFLKHRQTAWLVPQGDRDALVTVLARLVERPETLQNVAKQARREFEERFALDRCVEKFNAVLEEVAPPRGTW
ncbi:MAG: hypothetical protein Kow0069_02280 [Promethearchaeota archaeon]